MGAGWEQFGNGLPVLSAFFVFWWDIAGLPNTQLIIPLIIHNVWYYSDESKQFPQCPHFFLCLSPASLCYVAFNVNIHEICLSNLN